MPLGLPVEPEVYRRKQRVPPRPPTRGSHDECWPATMVMPPHVAVRVCMSQSPPVRRYTMTCSTVGPAVGKGLVHGTLEIDGMGPPRQPPSAVITSRAPAILDPLLDGVGRKKPPKTTECTAPMRAHACIRDHGPRGISGPYR